MYLTLLSSDASQFAVKPVSVTFVASEATTAAGLINETNTVSETAL